MGTALSLIALHDEFSYKLSIDELKDNSLNAISAGADNRIRNLKHEWSLTMSNPMKAMTKQPSRGQQEVVGVPGQHDEVTGSETRSHSIVGPVTFRLYNLDVKGLGTNPADPTNSQYIVAEDEYFVASVKVEFNRTPLTELLMCLGTRINIDFGLEGFGLKAAELNLPATLVTVKNVYTYLLETSPVRPIDVNMPSGLYEIGAAATVGPVENECTTKIWGHGYIEEVLLQVYGAGQE